MILQLHFSKVELLLLFTIVVSIYDRHLFQAIKFSYGHKHLLGDPEVYPEMANITREIIRLV